MLKAAIKLLELLIERRLYEVNDSAFKRKSLVLTCLLVICVEFKNSITSFELVEACVNSIISDFRKKCTISYYIIIALMPLIYNIVKLLDAEKK